MQLGQLLVHVQMTAVDGRHNPLAGRPDTVDVLVDHLPLVVGQPTAAHLGHQAASRGHELVAGPDQIQEVDRPVELPDDWRDRALRPPGNRFGLVGLVPPIGLCLVEQMPGRVVTGRSEGDVAAAQEVGGHAGRNLVVGREVVDRLDLLLWGLRTVDPPPDLAFGCVLRAPRHSVARMRWWLLDPLEAASSFSRIRWISKEAPAIRCSAGHLLAVCRLRRTWLQGTPMSSAYSSKVSCTLSSSSPAAGHEPPCDPIGSMSKAWSPILNRIFVSPSTSFRSSAMISSYRAGPGDAPDLCARGHGARHPSARDADTPAAGDKSRHLPAASCRTTLMTTHGQRCHYRMFKEGFSNRRPC